MNEDKNRTAISTTNMEQDLGDAAFPADCIKKMDTQVSIRVISYRRLNHDPDGISAKAAIDGIVQAGILADDSTKQVKEVTFESRKTVKGEDEKTIIEIECL